MRRRLGRFRLPLFLTLLLGLAGHQATLADSAAARADGAATFERLKGLAGEWRGEWSPGAVPTTVHYRVTANGSALLEEYQVGETTMTTVYHLDRGELVLTHYCSIGNQPRMRASAVSEDGTRIQFDFWDITNLGETGYSKQLVLTLIDEDHVSLSFLGSRTGKSTGVELARVR